MPFPLLSLPDVVLRQLMSGGYLDSGGYPPDTHTTLRWVPRLRVDHLPRRRLHRPQRDGLEADLVQRSQLLAVSPGWRGHFHQAPGSGENLVGLISGTLILFFKAATMLIDCGAEADRDRRRFQLMHQIIKRFPSEER